MTFATGGVKVGEATYMVESTDVKLPTVPNRAGYTGAWEEKTLTMGDVTVRGMTAIDTLAFDSCTGLKTVTLGADVIAIRESAFYRCSSITSVFLDGGSEHYGEIRKNSTSSGNSSIVGKLTY